MAESEINVVAVAVGKAAGKVRYWSCNAIHGVRLRSAIGI